MLRSIPRFDRLLWLWQNKRPHPSLHYLSPYNIYEALPKRRASSAPPGQKKDSSILRPKGGGWRMCFFWGGFGPPIYCGSRQMHYNLLTGSGKAKS